MARGNEVQYVQFYTAGSAARKVELPQKKPVQPKAEPVKKPEAEKVIKPLVKLDGLSVIGIVVSAVMLVCMLIGVVQVYTANQEQARMEAYVAMLEAENQSLHKEYEHGYDLDEIRHAAESMGMIAMADAQRVTVEIPEPEVVEEPTWWEQLAENFKTLFA